MLDFDILPRALEQWKAWVNVRKLFRRFCKLTLQHVNSDVAWAFRTWKYQHEDARRALKGLTKNQLVDRCIADENLLGTLNSKLARKKENIELMTQERDHLLNHFASGQKMAFTLAKNNEVQTRVKAFGRWKKKTNDLRMNDLDEQIEKTNAIIRDLSEHLAQAEARNKNLLLENEELRQASLDGIEIAKAVQELTKEREQLSVDLNDRAATVKKLIEDNNNLSNRLNLAQREAEQLERLNQQPPERDM